jgi:biopolymer transport protein TolR
MAAEFLSRYGGGGRRRSSYRPVSEINVTPFVDVMLVLLIVFMVTAPLLTVGVPVNLPKTKAKSIAESEEPLVITVNAEGAVFIQDTEVAI